MLRTRKDYYECPMHRIVRAKVREYLDESGEFSFEKVLEDLKLSNAAEYIRWDYVSDELENAGYNLIPAASLFYTRARNKFIITENGEKIKQIDVSPGKYLPIGNGKHIAGYVTDKNAPPILRETYMKYRYAMAQGSFESVSKKELQMIEAGSLQQTLLLQ